MHLRKRTHEESKDNITIRDIAIFFIIVTIGMLLSSLLTGCATIDWNAIDQNQFFHDIQQL